MQTVRVQYDVGTYTGEVMLYGVDPNEEDETVIARARKLVTRNAGGSLPFGAQSWKILSRTEEEQSK
jgi:hypothetical protein